MSSHSHLPQPRSSPRELPTGDWVEYQGNLAAQINNCYYLSIVSSLPVQPAAIGTINQGLSRLTSVQVEGTIYELDIPGVSLSVSS